MTKKLQDKPAAVERNEKGQLKKGASLNPGGMPKAIGEYRRQLATHIPEAIATLISLMKESTDDKVRLAASREVLDRGLGKPATEQIEARGDRLSVLIAALTSPETTNA